MSKPAQFTAADDGTAIMLDRTAVLAVYVETVTISRHVLDLAHVAPAATPAPRTIILGDRFEFTVRESYEDVVKTVWPDWVP